MSAPRKPKSPDGLYPLTVRDIPGDVLMGLEILADAQERSVEAEARIILQQAVRRRIARQQA